MFHNAIAALRQIAAEVSRCGFQRGDDFIATGVAFVGGGFIAEDDKETPAYSISAVSVKSVGVAEQ